MKNKVLLGFSYIIVITAVSFFFLLTRDKTKEEVNNIYDTLNSVSYTNLDSFISQEIDTYLYVGRPSCGDCVSFEPQFIEYLDEKNIYSTITYLNIEKTHSDDKEWEQFKKKYNIQYTPTIAKFNKGILISKVEWTPEKGISIPMISNWIENNL